MTPSTPIVAAPFWPRGTAIDNRGTAAPIPTSLRRQARCELRCEFLRRRDLFTAANLNADAQDSA